MVKLAFVAFVGILVGLLVHIGMRLEAGNASTETVARASQTSSAYYQLLNAASRAELHATSFLRTRDPQDRAGFDLALRDAYAASKVIDEEGSVEDRRRFRDVLGTYAQQIAETQRTFAAIERGQISPAEPPGIEIIHEVQLVLTREASASQARALETLDGYQRGQRNQMIFSVGALLFGLPVMLALLMVIQHYERRYLVSEVEMHRLERVALTDSLTGLRNHRSFQEQLTSSVVEAMGAQTNLSLALVDIDRFKDVNDSEGHARGDQILIMVAKLLEKGGSNSHIFRIGGDEFAIILPGMEPNEVLGFGESLRILAAQGLGGSTLSIGLAHRDRDDDGEILREKADIALYRAKRRGRNAVAIYAGESGVTSPVTQVKINSLRYLLQYASVDVAFQPVWLTEGRRLIAYEALTRIPARFGLNGPQEAFDIAERLGRSYDLDMIAIEAILDRAKVIPNDAMLFVNLSPRSLEHAKFSVDGLAAKVRTAGFEPSRVCFELTEHSTASVELVQRIVADMRAAGFRIALDDVGSGNSGLEMLRLIPVDYVKIDRSVVRGAVELGAGRAVLMAIVAFAAEAGAFVIAEGIEDEEMMHLVEEISEKVGTFRIQGVQGYLLGKPSESIDSPTPVAA